MAVVDAVARIQELTQATAVLGGRAAPTVGASDFAAALLAALGTAGAAGAGATGAAAPTANSRLARTDGVTGEDLVAEAKSWVGVPYVLGGDDRSGIDCSGLVQQVLGAFGIDAERRVSQQTDLGVEVGSLAEAQPGDLIITNNADHVVIYAGDGMIVHAPYEGRTVSYQKNYLDESDVLTIRRVVPAAGEAGAGVTGAGTVAAPASTPLASAGGASELLTALLGLGLGSGSAASPYGAGAGLGSGLGAAGLGAAGLGPGTGLADLVAAAQLRALLGSAA